jgi:hypothetical protein
MKRLFALIVSKCNRQTRRSLRFPKALRVVDSTTVTVGKNRLAWTPYHGERAGVHMHVAYSPEQHMPSDIVETVGRRHVQKAMGRINAKRHFRFMTTGICRSGSGASGVDGRGEGCIK